MPRAGLGPHGSWCCWALPDPKPSVLPSACSGHPKPSILPLPSPQQPGGHTEGVLVPFPALPSHSRIFHSWPIPSGGKSHRGPARAALNPCWPLAQKQRPPLQVEEGSPASFGGSSSKPHISHPFLPGWVLSPALEFAGRVGGGSQTPLFSPVLAGGTGSSSWSHFPQGNLHLLAPGFAFPSLFPGCKQYVFRLKRGGGGKRGIKTTEKPWVELPNEFYCTKFCACGPGCTVALESSCFPNIFILI